MHSNRNIEKTNKPMRQFSEDESAMRQRNKQKEEAKRLRELARHEKMSLLTV